MATWPVCYSLPTSRSMKLSFSKMSLAYLSMYRISTIRKKKFLYTWVYLLFMLEPLLTTQFMYDCFLAHIAIPVVIN